MNHDISSSLPRESSRPPRRGRVVAVHKDRWELLFQAPEESFSAEPTPAVLAGRFRSAASGPGAFPVVGDWVSAEGDAQDSVARIIAVAPRSGVLARKRPGETEHDAVVEQVLAANIDLALLAMAVDEDFSPRRLERYLTMAWDSGATPVVVLTKADLAGTDLAPDLASRVADAEEVAFGSRLVVTSARTGDGVEELRGLLKTGTTSILLGSSGVGKSSLLNALAGTDLQKVSQVRDYDGKGRHTTTSRRLVPLPWGAFLVDTPGLRELQLWAEEEALGTSFPDVEAYAEGCRFADCSHQTEPGCAVLQALEEGGLSLERLESWRRLRRELAYLERRTDGTAARAEREKWKSIAKLQKELYRRRDS